MKPILEIHPIQAQILRDLLFNSRARFSQLNKEKLPTDHFNFHLKSLVESGLLIKGPSSYQLTTAGKEFANRFDTEKLLIERQAKVAVAVGCVRVHNGRREYLIQQRLKNPYYGYHGFVTGKIRWGETVLETAKREVGEETGMVANKLDLVGIEHKIDYSSEGELLEDKYFFTVRAEDLGGKTISEFEGGKNIWVAKEKIKELPKLFDDMASLVDMYESQTFSFKEFKYTVKEY